MKVLSIPGSGCRFGDIKPRPSIPPRHWAERGLAALVPQKPEQHFRRALAGVGVASLTAVAAHLSQSDMIHDTGVVLLRWAQADLMMSLWRKFSNF